jgi:hypothetical protein
MSEKIILEKDLIIPLAGGKFQGRNARLCIDTERTRSAGFAGSITTQGWLCELTGKRKNNSRFEFISDDELIDSAIALRKETKTNA